MKKIFHNSVSVVAVLILAVCIVGNPAASHGQEVQTLFGNDIRHGGFGGPVVKFGQVDGDGAVWVGGRGGWIINFANEHAISIGGGGYGLVSEHTVPQQMEAGVQELAAMGYGGFETEYTNNTYRLVHWTASALIGAGGLTTRDKDFNEIDENTNAFFVFEPGLHAELNITHFFRIAAGASWRLTSGIDKAGYRDSDFSGVNAVLTFKFGAF